MIFIDTISMATSAPQLNTTIQLCYDYNTTIYNLIEIHIHQLFISSSNVLHFEWFKNVIGKLPQALEIIFEVQRKRSNEKITRRKISFPTY